MKWLRSLQHLPPLPVAIGISLLLSWYSVLTHPLLNNDAYSYLRAAEVFQQDGLQAVLSDFGWYGYSIVFALLDPLLPGNLLHSAQILNAGSYALLIFSFISLCRELNPGASRRLQWFSVLTILAYPEINELRYFLIRDIAFWAFALLSLSLLIRFTRQASLITAIGWCLALFAAISMRLEGLLILGLAPLSLCLPQRHFASTATSAALLFGVLGAGAVLVWILSLTVNIQLLELMQFAYRYYLPLLYNLGSEIRDTLAALSQLLFTTENFPGADKLWPGSVVIGLAYVFTVLVNLVYALSLPLTLLLIWGYRKGLLSIPRHARRPYFAYLGSALLALVLFIFIMHFLTQRYAVLASLLLLSLVPRALDQLYQSAVDGGRLPRLRAWLIIMSGYFLIDSLISFGYSQQYIEDTIAWTQQSIPADAQLLTNHYAVAYHSHRITAYDQTNRDPNQALSESHSGDYLVLEVKHNNAQLQAQLEQRADLELLEVFRNKRDDQLRAYRVKDRN